MTAWRDKRCGTLRKEDVGSRVLLAGWTARRRDHGGLVFVDLRDETGIVQLVVNPEHSKDAAEAVQAVRNEFVLQAEGEVVARAPEVVNETIPTGEVEVLVDRLTVVSAARPLPFQVGDDDVGEEMRFRYRWLDLRGPRLQKNLRMRSRAVRIIRDVMEDDGFVDIETPILWKPTPEGARDFLVPARLQPGRFYALPQSPQIAKQLLAVSGFERYYQIARCFRDEDLRADRLQELTQLDVEMTFPERDYIFGLMERIVQRMWRECRGVEVEIPFRRMPFDEAELRYGSDKPDLRFDLEIQDATEITRGSGFGVFGGADQVRYLTVPRELSRGDIDKLEQIAKEWGAKGLAYLIYGADGEVRSPIAKFLSEREIEHFRPEPGSTVLFGAGEERRVGRVLGALRLHLGRELGLVDESRWEFLWVTDMPLLAWDDEAQRWTAEHHPFTRPNDEGIALLDTDPGKARAVAYDLVGNGLELAGGSFRIHEQELQAKIFDFLGISREEQQARFGFLLEALTMGAPPHGGIASGIDRLMMALLPEDRIRDTQAFPKNQAGVDLMSGSPTWVDDRQLAETGLQLKPGVRPTDP
jgi:aspartyl-tRNA synthetase